MRLWAWLMTSPRRYAWGARWARLGQRMVARAGWVRASHFFPLSAWTEGRDLPALAPQSFRQRWEDLDSEGEDA